jgi:hypothetical protein
LRLKGTCLKRNIGISTAKRGMKPTVWWSVSWVSEMLSQFLAMWRGKSWDMRISTTHMGINLFDIVFITMCIGMWCDKWLFKQQMWRSYSQSMSIWQFLIGNPSANGSKWGYVPKTHEGC